MVVYLFQKSHLDIQQIFKHGVRNLDTVQQNHLDIQQIHLDIQQSHLDIQQTNLDIDKPI